MSYAAFGVVIKKNTSGATGTFSALPKIRDSGGPEYSLDTIDVTSHDSTGGWEEVAPTILRSGTFTFNALHDPRSTGIEQLKADQASKRLAQWQVYLPAATDSSVSDILHFNGYVTGVTQGQPFEGAKTIDVTVKPTGSSSWTTATGP